MPAKRLPGRHSPHLALTATGLAAVAVFAADQRAAMATGFGSLYVAVVLIGLWPPYPWFPWATAALCSALIVAGHGAADGGFGAEAVHRSYALADVWVVAVIGYALKRRTADQAADRYRRLFEQASLGMYESSADGRFVTVNPALVRMLGYDSPAEVLALRFDRDLYVDPEEWRRLVHTHAELGEPVNGVRARWRRRDGTPISVRLNGVPADRPFGPPGGFSMIVEDVTAQDVVERQLRQAQKMEAVGQLTSGIAHDFNNILTVVMASAELVALQLAPDSPLQRDVTTLRQAAERGSMMVRRLLSLGRRDMMAPIVFDAHTAVAEVLELIRRVLPSNIEIATRCDRGVGRVRADRGALEQILLNLATNARDAMPGGGRLTIACDRVELDARYTSAHPWVTPGRYFRLSVTDTGIGMDEETQRHIFEPFFTRKPPGEGTGLGMAMVYTLMKQHHGMVHVYSEPGHGTAVKLFFPLVEGLGETEPAPREAGPRPRGHEGLLVVDDDPAVLRLAERTLSAHGYRVLTAADGEEALARLAAAPGGVDLVVCDLVMPRLGGREFAETARARNPGVRVLFTSGYADNRLDALAGLSGGQPVLRKPWSASELLQRVRQALDAA